MAGGSREIPVSEARPGMILNQELRDREGKPLLPKGTRLTPLYINRLAKWAISSIAIVDESESGEEEDADSALEPVMQGTTRIGVDAMAFQRAMAVELSARFAGHESNPLMTRIKVCALRKLIECGLGGIRGVAYPDAPAGRSGTRMEQAK